MKIIRKLWWGEYSLARAFWGFFIAGWILSPLVAAILSVPLFLLGLRPVALLLVTVAFVAYPFLAGVGVWRSADAYPYTRWWPVMAKGFVLLMCGSLYGSIFWHLVNGGAQLWMEQITSR